MRYCKWSSQSGLCCWQYWTEVESSIECVTCTIPIRGVKHYMRDMDINSWSQAFYARHGRYQVMITVGVVDRKLDSWIVVAQIDSQAAGANFDNCEASRSKLLHGCLGAMPLWHEGRSCFPLQISETRKHSSFLSWMEVEYVVL